MRTLNEFMEFYGIKKIKYGKKEGSKRYTARFQDHNGAIQTLFYSEKIDLTKPLYVSVHTGQDAEGNLTHPRLVGSLWVVNSGWNEAGEHIRNEE